MQVSSSASLPVFGNDALKDLWATKTVPKNQSGQTVSSQSGPLSVVEDVAAEASASAITTVGSLATASITKASSSSVGDAMNAYMSGQPKGEDKYIRAKEMAASTLNAMQTAQNAILSAGMVQGGLAENYAEKALAGMQAANRLEEQKGKATLDQSQENLDEISEDVEERAEAAVNPEEGDAASTEITEKTDAEKSDAGKADAADEAKGADVATDSAAAAAGETVSAEKLTPAGASQPQQAATPSVDIIV